MGSSCVMVTVVSSSELRTTTFSTSHSPSSNDYKGTDRRSENGVRELEIERDGFLVEFSHDDVPVVIEFEGPEVDHHLILVDVRHDRALVLLAHLQLFDASIHVEVKREVRHFASRYLGSNVDLDRRRDAEPT